MVRGGSYAPSAVVWHLGVRGLPADGIAHHNIHFGSAWEESFEQITKRKELTTFTYDTSRCMFCGLCEDACPVDALELTQDFEMATYTREGQIWDRQMLEEGPKPTQYKC